MRKWKSGIQLSVRIWDEDWRKQSVTRWERAYEVKATASPCRFLLSISVPADTSAPPASWRSGCWGKDLWASQTSSPRQEIPSLIKCEGDVC